MVLAGLPCDPKNNKARTLAGLVVAIAERPRYIRSIIA
jgi:hypothetical protein